VLALVLVVAVPALATQDDLERRMLEVAAGLRCPVCQNLSVADSMSEMARDMRALIIDQLRAGRAPEEIRAYFVSKYGPWILLSPPARGIGLLVWVLPVLGAVAALAGTALALRRWARHRSPGASFAADAASLVEALRELEFDHRAGKLSSADYQELRALYERRAGDARAREEQTRLEMAARPIVDERRVAPGTRPRRRAWRWAAAGVGLLTFGIATGLVLGRALRERGEGSMTGDALTGTRQTSALADLQTRDLGTLLAAGRGALERQDYPTALRAFSRALEIDPGQPVANAYQGLLLHRGGHSDRALAAFERALARDPRLAPALWGKGLVLYEARGRPAEALQVWQQLLMLELSDEDREHVERAAAEARAKVAKASAPAR
jgi:cytochrome c-type biogenesis protein CcmH/NrfF